ncbi:MAG: hypothetical protein HRT89_13700 [Lentisphaeria bacterium]|nr:hypothetical protein [Lentisphaeria bacterium]NQZ69112.1 hypothetical protein [Lentisphaeria bacterium]
MKWDKENFMITEGEGLKKTLYTVGVAGLILTLILGFTGDGQRAVFFSYLTSFMFWLTIALGALFFIMVHHLVGARWPIVLRRIFENLSCTIPIMAILFIPIILGMEHLYGEWLQNTDNMTDHTKQSLLIGKQDFWLSKGFFFVRVGIYFVILSGLALLLRGQSIKQDKSGHTRSITNRMKLISAPGMFAFALTLTFIAFDWIMSIDPYWFSTIFGLYVFAGSVLAIMTFTIIFLTIVRKEGVLLEETSIEHYHDLGKMTFAFIIFWTYIAFSQFVLQWYANLPEETIFFLRRWDHTIFLNSVSADHFTGAKDAIIAKSTGNWKGVTLFLLFFHFMLPLVLLMSRIPKRCVKLMTILAVWIICMHYIDLKWLIDGSMLQAKAGMTGAAELPANFAFRLADITSFVGVGGIFLGFFWHLMISDAAVPIKDVRLKDSINFINA